MSIKAGELRHRVRIDRPVLTQNATTGETTHVWTTIGTTWAKVAPVSGREFLAAQANQSQINAKITVRATGGGINWDAYFMGDNAPATWRAVHMMNGQAGKIYEIHAILPDNESGLEWLTLMCAAGVNDGQ